MNSLVVRSQRVVLPDGVRPAAIHVGDGRIIDVAPYSDRPANVRELDAGELMVLPGLVDTHVHMNDPGTRALGRGRPCHPCRRRRRSHHAR